MDSYPAPDHNTRLGFHYFPDTLHYRETDSQTWIPELRALGASWLVLLTSSDRAIPEAFIHRLITAGIQPVLNFNLPLSKPPKPEELRTLLETYAKWGVDYIILFAKPNHRPSWDSKNWIQEDLVERFLDRYVPLAQLAQQCGLIPVFPPLQPGGAYWDTAFLRTALQSLQRRKQDCLLDRMVLSAFAWSWNKALNWGAGGPERWPGARPYTTPPGEEDQIGFRAYDWYLAISQAELKHPTPIILLEAGIREDPNSPSAANYDRGEHAKTNLSIGQLLAGAAVTHPNDPGIILEKISPHVLCGNLWLLASAVESPYISQAWFQPEGQSLPVTGAFKQWIAEKENRKSVVYSPKNGECQHPISHYLLIPMYEWGVADWHLDLIRPFVKRYRPTIGFSVQEAILAERVTVIGSDSIYSDEDILHLRQAGCQVDRIKGDGTSIATQLAER